MNEIDGSNLKSVKDLPSLKQGRKGCKAVYLKGEVYVFGGLDDKLNKIMTVEKIPYPLIFGKQ